MKYTTGDNGALGKFGFNLCGEAFPVYSMVPMAPLVGLQSHFRSPPSSLNLIGCMSGKVKT